MRIPSQPDQLVPTVFADKCGVIITKDGYGFNFSIFRIIAKGSSVQITMHIINIMSIFILIYDVKIEWIQMNSFNLLKSFRNIARLHRDEILRV